MSGLDPDMRQNFAACQGLTLTYVIILLHKMSRLTGRTNKANLQLRHQRCVKVHSSVVLKLGHYDLCDLFRKEKHDFHENGPNKFVLHRRRKEHVQLGVIRAREPYPITFAHLRDPHQEVRRRKPKRE